MKLACLVVDSVAGCNGCMGGWVDGWNDRWLGGFRLRGIYGLVFDCRLDGYRQVNGTFLVFDVYKGIGKINIMNWCYLTDATITTTLMVMMLLLLMMMISCSSSSNFVQHILSFI